MSIAISPFGQTKSGQPVHRYQLIADSGMEVDIIDFGATVTAIRVPDRDGNIADVALGYDTLEEYENGTSFFGAIVGRLGNRLAHGRFSLDGITYQIPSNDKAHSLHGGIQGFGMRVWSAEVIPPADGGGVKLTYVSPDGEEGYPGELTSEVTYRIEDGNALAIDYRLTTDAPTVTNLTNHSYFNLDGEGSSSILNHEAQISASRYTLTDESLIPTGELPSLEETPLDFREPAVIGARIDTDFPALRYAGGYDHNYVLDGAGFRQIARVYSPNSGRVLDVSTTEPGVQFYSGNFLKGAPGKAGHTYPHRSGFCLETQHFPDSPNHPEFPCTVLRPGDTYTSRTVYRFTTGQI
jgi:aldose 1-epimerase